MGIERNNETMRDSFIFKYRKGGLIRWRKVLGSEERILPFHRERGGNDRSLKRRKNEK